MNVLMYNKMIWEEKNINTYILKTLILNVSLIDRRETGSLVNDRDYKKVTKDDAYWKLFC